MKDLDIKLEQYRIYAAELYSFENRAQTTSRLYIALNTISISVITLGSDLTKGINVPPIFICALSIIAIAFCMIWRLTLRSVTEHTTAKHIVIQEMEKDLPFKPYTDEWFKHLNEGKGYIRTTVLHEFFPWIFICIYFSLVIFTLVYKIN